MATALVTGGTSGIGLAFANRYASLGHDLVIVGRDEHKLSQICAELVERYQVDVEPKLADLTKLDQIQLVQERLSDADRPVDVLVNCAGFGVNAKLLADDDDFKLASMNLMVNAVMLLSSTAARGMVERGRGTIINIGSVSAWIIKGNYSAIKSWVVTYTRALAAELTGTGVQAVVVIPGWVKTDWHAKSGVKQPKLPSWAWTHPEQVVDAALDAVDKGKATVTPHWLWRIIVPALRRAPEGMTRRISQRLIKSREAN